MTKTDLIVVAVLAIVAIICFAIAGREWLKGGRRD